MKKMEKEMETVFDTKVNEKRSKLKQSEQELMRKHEQVTLLFELSKAHFSFFSKRKSTKLILQNLSSDDENSSESETSGRSDKRAFRHGIIF
jgi:hypothetical protein